MLVSALLEKLPEYNSFIPSICFFCEEPLTLNEKMTSLKCENPLCAGFLGNRISAMAAVLGIKGFGEAVCEDIVYKHDLKKIHEIFELAPESLTDLYLSENNIKLHGKLIDGITNVVLSDAITSMCLIGIGDKLARKIFEGYTDMDTFYADFDTDDRFIIKKLGKEATAHGSSDYNFKKQIPHIRQVLEVGREEICKFVSYFTIKQIPKDAINITITGGVPGYSNKEKFVEMLNSKYSKYIVLNKSLTKDIKYLIVNSKEETRKTKDAAKYGTIVLTSAEFVELVQAM
ncbi:hypothetical protein ABGV42_02000 [Paenibacillus pabuli]|uniref:hypothetical protein n=1 Tax=Paenibacillus pabuli TaxID=1472 RepID=UPI003241DB20